MEEEEGFGPFFLRGAQSHCMVYGAGGIVSLQLCWSMNHGTALMRELDTGSVVTAVGSMGKSLATSPPIAVVSDCSDGLR